MKKYILTAIFILCVSVGVAFSGVLSDFEQETIALVEKVKPTVVKVLDPSKNAKGKEGLRILPKYMTSRGTGVVIGPDGYILTNYHVVEGMESVYVEFYDGKRFFARTIGLDKHTDLAVLKVDADHSFRTGEWVNSGPGIVPTQNNYPTRNG